MRNFVYVMIGMLLSCFAAFESRADVAAAPPAPVTPPAWFTSMAAPPVYLQEADITQTSPVIYPEIVEDAPPQTSAPVATQSLQSTTETSPQPVAAPSISADNFVPTTTANYVEAGINDYSVSNNYGNWFGEFVDGQYQTDPWNRWSLQLQHEEEFHDEGVSTAIGNVHTFDADWFSDVGVGFGSDADFLNKYTASASINRKWLDARNLVTTLGVTWDEAQSTYQDVGLLIGAAYYFPGPWAIQGNVRIIDSTPGDVIAPSATLAVTYGYAQHYFLTARVGVAREAYQLLNTDDIVNAFDSETVGFNWRQWVGDDYGFNLGGEYYTNPYYTRIGGLVSVFKEF